MKNLVRTNTNNFKKRAYNYLIDAMRNDENEDENPETVVLDFFTQYETAGNFDNNKRRIPNNQERLADYLMGLPTNLPYSNYQILEDAKTLHGCKELTAKEETTIINGHWSFWALHILSLENLALNRKLNNFLNS
jgi:hypothetical protein